MRIRQAVTEGRTDGHGLHTQLFLSPSRRDNKWESRWACAWDALLLVRYFISVLLPQLVGISMPASGFVRHCHYPRICVCECMDPVLQRSQALNQQTNHM